MFFKKDQFIVVAKSIIEFNPKDKEKDSIHRYQNLLISQYVLKEKLCEKYPKNYETKILWTDGLLKKPSVLEVELPLSSSRTHSSTYFIFEELRKVATSAHGISNPFSDLNFDFYVKFQTEITPKKSSIVTNLKGNICHYYEKNEDKYFYSVKGGVNIVTVFDEDFFFNSSIKNSNDDYCEIQEIRLSEDFFGDSIDISVSSLVEDYPIRVENDYKIFQPAIKLAREEKSLCKNKHTYFSSEIQSLLTSKK